MTDKDVPLIDADGDGYIDLPPIDDFMPTHFTAAGADFFDKLVAGESNPAPKK